MLKHMSAPITINGMTARNRFVVSGMVTNFCNMDGTATERFIAYHEAKAKGEYGIVCTEDYAIDPRGRGYVNVAGIWCDDQIESHSKLADRVHAQGAKLIGQIYHAGRQTCSLVTGMEIWGPSAVPCPMMQEIPHAMTIEEIKETVLQFGRAAARLKKAGFDGVEVHAAHGYLLAAFLSTASNRRTDEYGGCLTNRMRFTLEVIEEVRKQTGPEFVIGIRLSGNENVPDGLNVEDCKAIAMAVEEAGVDYIHVSSGLYEGHDSIVATHYNRHGCFSDYAAEVKKIVSIPVITVGRINDPRIAEEVVASGKADLVAMSRASLCDPEMPNKAMAGKFDEIRYCIACNRGCAEQLLKMQPIRCALNPTLGREYEVNSLKAPESKKKIVVVGGGAGGMQAAITAAERGHDVTIYEKDFELGGQFRYAAVAPFKAESTSFLSWQKQRVSKLGIKVKLNTELDLESALGENADAYIIAAGAAPFIVPVPGIDSEKVIIAQDILAGKKSFGSNVVVIGGGLIGVETAMYLIRYHRNVTIVEMGPAIASKISADDLVYIMRYLKEGGARILTNTALKAVTEAGVMVGGDTEEEIAADTVVLAAGGVPRAALGKALESAGKKVYTIGDAKEVAFVMDAVTAGFEAGITI